MTGYVEKKFKIGISHHIVYLKTKIDYYSIGLTSLTKTTHDRVTESLIKFKLKTNLDDYISQEEQCSTQVGTLI